MPTLMKNEYLMRHERVGIHLHNSKFKALGVEMNEKLYERARQSWCVKMQMYQCYGIKGTHR